MTIKIKHIWLKFTFALIEFFEDAKKSFLRIKRIGVKNGLYFFIRRKIAKVPEGQIASKWVAVCAWILFPLRMFVLKNQVFNYDAQRNIFVIEGTKFSQDFFDLWKTGIMPIGTIFKIIQRADGIRAVKRFPKLEDIGNIEEFLEVIGNLQPGQKIIFKKADNC